MSDAKYAGFQFATKTGVPAQSSSGTVNSTPFDRLTYSHMVATLNGASFQTGYTLDVRVQDSSSLTSGFANYTPDVLFDNNNTAVTYAAFPQMTTNGTIKLDVDLSAAKRYIRFVGVAAGGTVVYGVNCLIGQRSGTVPGASA